MDYKVIQSFYSLLLRDARTFQQHIITRTIDACVWAGSSLYVVQYIFPLFGMSTKFGSFLVAGNLAVWGMFEVGTNMAILIGDLQGTNSLSYYLTLPIPSTLIFIRIALMDAYKSILPTIPLLPLSKLILQDNLSLSSIHYPKLILTWILAHIFFGFFGLFISSMSRSFEYITTIRQRILFPLWYLGCFQFTWYMIYSVNPTLAYINLVNPVTYIMEAMRACVATDFEGLPFNLCIMVIVLWTIFFGYFGIRNFKKRLNCV